jgi:hypothetical protein
MSSEADTNGGVQLNAVIVEAIAQRVAELLRAELGLWPRLLTPSQVAERFAVSRTWVYEHAVELGVIRLGHGPRARLRFDADRVEQALSRVPTQEPSRDDSPRRGRGHRRLLPIGSE